MALLNKLFSKRKQADKNTPTPLPEVPVKLSPEFNENQLRVVMFRDSNARGLRVLFDSSSVERVPLDDASLATATATRSKCKFKTRVTSSKSGDFSSSGKNLEFAEISEGFGYRYLAPKSDVQELGKMAFGADVAMSFQGCTYKIHYTSSKNLQMFISLVFPAPLRRKRNREWQQSSMSDTSFDGSVNSSVSSLGESNDVIESSSPALSPAYPWSQFHLDSSTAGRKPGLTIGPPSMASNASLESESNSSVNGGGSGSSLSNAGSEAALLPGLMRCRYWQRAGSIPRRPTQESLSEADPKERDQCSKNAAKLALGLIVDLGEDIPARQRLESFILVHMRSLETLLWRLKTTLETVYSYEGAPFVHSMYLASAEFVQSVVDLYVIPRLSRPLWTVMLASGEDCLPDFAKEFVPDFFYVLERFDSKETNFFVSTMLTAVLTYHLGWTTPFLKELSDVEDSPVSGFDDVDVGCPVQMQMDSINGLLGFPPKSARTLIAGNDQGLLYRFLSVFSFFLRFSLVKELTHNQREGAGGSSVEGVEKEFKRAAAAPVLEKRIPAAVPESWSSETLKAPTSTASLRPSLSPSGSGLKRTRSFVSRLSASASDKLYPDLSQLTDNVEGLNLSGSSASVYSASNLPLSVQKEEGASYRRHRKTRSADLTRKVIVTEGTAVDSLVRDSDLSSYGSDGIEVIGGDYDANLF